MKIGIITNLEGAPKCRPVTNRLVTGVKVDINKRGFVCVRSAHIPKRRKTFNQWIDKIWRNR